MAKGKKGAKKAETDGAGGEVAPVMIARGGLPGGLRLSDIEETDMVVIVRGLYEVDGAETNSDKDTLKLAATKGRMTWIPQDAPNGLGQHDTHDNRKVAVKFFAMLSTPQKAKPKAKAAKSDGPAMSETAFG